MSRVLLGVVMLSLVLAASCSRADTPAATSTSAPASASAPATAPLPAITVFGMTDSPASVVFLVNHSATSTDFVDPLRAEIGRMIGDLKSPTKVAFYVFSEDLRALTGDELSEATAEYRKRLATAYEQTDSAGNPEGQVKEFAAAFKAGIALKPEAIYFVTYTKPSPKLAAAVKELNKDAKVRINVLALLANADADAEAALEKIAKDSGGSYKLLREKDVGKK